MVDVACELARATLMSTNQPWSCAPIFPVKVITTMNNHNLFYGINRIYGRTALWLIRRHERCRCTAKTYPNILSPLTGKSEYTVTNSAHFVSTVSDETILDNEIMVSFDVESLFTNVPIDAAVQTAL